MADNQYNTLIKLEADTEGAKQVEQALDSVGKKAKEFDMLRDAIFGGKSKKDIKDLEDGTLKLADAFKMLRTVAGGVSIYTTVIGAFGKIEEAYLKIFEMDEKIRKLREEAERETNTKNIENLAEAYDKLSKAVDDASKARQRANEIEDIATSAAREIEDASADAAKNEEIAALDPNDPYYDRKRAQIDAKYSALQANRTAQRKVEDAETKQNRTLEESEAKSAEAVQRRVALIDDRRQLDILKGKLREAQVASMSENEYDAGTPAEAALVNILRLAGLQGGFSRLGDTSTVKGDEKRKEAENKAKELEAKVKDLEKDIAKKEKKIADLESEAQFLSQKSVAIGGTVESAKDVASVMSVQGSISEQKASRDYSAAIEKDREEAAKEKAKQEDATRAKALLEKQIPETERQIYLQKQRIASADASVAQAKAAYDNATGSAKGTAAQRLQQVTQTAAETKDEANRLIKQLQETLSGMKSVMTAATSALNKNNSQRLTAQAQQYVSQ